MKSIHYAMLKSIFGEELYSCLFDCDNKSIDIDRICLKRNSKLKKIVAVMFGYAPFVDPFAAGKIINFMRQKDIRCVFADNSVYGKLLGKIKKLFPDVYIVSYFPDIERQLMGEQFKEAKLLRKASLAVMMRNEKKTVKFADRQMVLNCRDKKLYEHYYNKEPTDIIPVVINTEVCNETCEMHRSGDILRLLFVGVDYYPNVRGLRWFIKNVCPKIDREFTLIVAGRGMEKYSDEWTRECQRVNVAGTVDSLSKYYSEADVVVAPIFEGGGMKVKTAEALAYGKMFIGTEESLVGYWDSAGELRDQCIFLCNTSDEFAQRISELADKDFCKYNTSLHEWAKTEYSFESNINKFRSIFCNY